jgi:hypothetical protein
MLERLGARELPGAVLPVPPAGLSSHAGSDWGEQDWQYLR